jgi:hypothetical protein
MIKKYTVMMFISLFIFPTLAWAGFFAREVVDKTLDDYEKNLGKARGQMTTGTDQAVTNKGRGLAPVVKRTGGTGPQRKTFETEVGYEVYDYIYQETLEGSRFMKLKGMFYGVYLRATFRPNQLDPFYSDAMDFFRFELRYAWASLHYDGGVQNMFGERIADLSVNNIPDYVLETRILMGKDMGWNGTTFTPYSGFGFRHLNDDSSDQYGDFTYGGDDYSLNGYKRKSFYYYLPIGVDVKKMLADSWQVGANAEFDYLLYGVQKSYIEGSGRVPTNKQREGYGLRGSLRVEKLSTYYGLSIEPYVRFWDIENSEIADGGMEPSNITREIGLRLGLTF